MAANHFDTINFFGREMQLATAAPLIVAICSFVGKIFWAAAGGALKKLASLWDEVIVECPVPLGGIDEDLAKLSCTSASLHCLVVRYGNDTYLRDMASDQEKYEGRLRNRVINVPRLGSDTKLLLPVHNRLGTQFKMYLSLIP